jgi:hypothetical protein
VLRPAWPHVRDCGKNAGGVAAHPADYEP